MENGQITRWFLGANSGAGFYSLYDSFGVERDDFLWVIKGGPGCGKSGFMKRIGRAAEEAGLDVEYILCSGDPASLDGIYLPSLKTGWVDGTAPHILDPLCFGATGAYLNLGAFCEVETLQKMRDEIYELMKCYRKCYDRAYSHLSALAAIGSVKHNDLIGSTEISAAVRRAASTASRELPKAKKNTVPGRVTMRFLSAITCDGRVFLKETLTTLCKRIYVLDDKVGLAAYFIGEMLNEAQARGLDVILCPSPLAPRSAEALIIPSLSLGFLASAGDAGSDITSYRHVRLDAMADTELVRDLRTRIRSDTKVEMALTESAISALRGAKQLHDKVEALSNPYIDFESVYAAADMEIARVIE